MRNGIGVELDGGARVLHTADAEHRQRGGLSWARLVGAPEGATRLSQFHLRQAGGDAPTLCAGDSEAVLFILDGDCEVCIAGRAFEAEAGCGVFVRAGEAFSMQAAGTEVSALLTCCPAREDIDFPDGPPGGGDEDPGPRVVRRSDSRRQATGERHYQLLVGPGVGSSQVTQFIGMIPPSKAPEHFHQYEEAICILSGSGRLWAGDSQAPVAPGSIIFLPIRQPHCLECLDPAGMELVGVFYPAGSPAVSYAADGARA